MAKYEIDFCELCGYEPVAFRVPDKKGDLYVNANGEVTECDGYIMLFPRLILKRKGAEKKARPYNAEEMRNLYIERARLVIGSESGDVTGYRADTNEIRLGQFWWDAKELQDDFTHLDGSRCEVEE